MKIFKNQSVLDYQNDNIVRGELSNVAMVVQTPQVLTDYYSINADASTTINGMRNVEEYVGLHSSVVYDVIENTPISGIDNLISTTTFDEEVGFDEDFTSSGIVFPNTVIPKPGDCFTIRGKGNTALYQVTGITPITVRSNPFTEITFRLLSRSVEMIDQLKKQTKEIYTTVVTSIGTDKSLVIKKSTYFSIREHVMDYIELVRLYTKLFFDRTKAAFVIDGFRDPDTEARRIYLDTIMWKFLFDNKIVAYDDIVAYANNNYNMNLDRSYIDMPVSYLTDYEYDCSPIARIYRKDKRKKPLEYMYPRVREEEAQIGKFTGTNVRYIEAYVKLGDPDPFNIDGLIFDEDFGDRIESDRPYTETDAISNMNISIRNAIIAYYNDRDVDWSDIAVSDDRNMENYYMIPILLGIYKKFIEALK